MVDTPPHDRESIDSERLDVAAEFALDRIDEMLDAFGPDRFPKPASDADLRYGLVDTPTNWTESFWTGLLWIADVIGDDGRYGETAAGHLGAFQDRLESGNTRLHDLGIIYTLAAWATYDRTGDAAARQTALRAADLLADRYHPEPGIIQAWGDHRPGLADTDSWNYGGTIVDTMLVLPLLYRAAAATGYDWYREIAVSQTDRTAEHIVRDDGSTAHGFGFDVETGAPEGERTHQGYADDSCWARGQAWAIYGFPLSYRHTGAERFLDTAKRVADWYLDQLPADRVPPWDFRAEEDPDLRDSSAAAIAACGLLELAGHLPPADPDRQRYEQAALATLRALDDGYRAGPDSTGILEEGAYNWNEGQVEQCTIWGDYFYVEGLVRATRDWTPFWARR